MRAHASRANAGFAGNDLPPSGPRRRRPSPRADASAEHSARSAATRYNRKQWAYFDKLKAGLARTAQQFQQRFEALVEQADAPEQRTRAVDVETLEALEELLIMADVGVAATDEIVEAVRKRARRGESLRELVKEEILRIFNERECGRPPTASSRM